MERYSLVRSQIYARINALKERNSSFAPFKIGVKSYVTSSVLDRLDKMHQLISVDGLTTDQAADHIAGMPSISPSSSSPTSSGLTAENAAIAAIKQALHHEPFARYEMLDRVAEKGWQLPSRELAALLELDTLNPDAFNEDAFERYGYRFTKTDASNETDAWTVKKL